MFHYYQVQGGEEKWQPVPAGHLAETLQEKKPMFVTVLSVSKLVDDLSYEDKLRLHYMGPLYFDWDSKDEQLVIDKANEFLDKLEDLGVDLSMCRLYATGGRGYHLEIPPALFMEKVPKTGVMGLPHIYREMALTLVVDTLDLKIYSTGRGRMWRQPNVQRDNDRYKVAITVEEMREMTPELSRALSAEPRSELEVTPPAFCVKLSIEYSKSQQKVEELLKKRAKYKPDPKMREKASSHSIQWMMAGIGIKDDVGFQQIATQLAIAAVAAGLTEDQLVSECQGLITSHSGDGNRYGSEAKRTEELRRMHRYMDGNACYEFSVGAIKSLLVHPAIDLDGIAATKDEVKTSIEEAVIEAADDDKVQDEYGDVAKGVTLAKHGVYMDTEHGKKRICAMSFANPAVLKSSDASQIIGYDSDILINGAFMGRVTLEIDIFSGLVPFNRFASKYGHAFQGTDVQVRTVMMRFVEKAKKENNVRFVVSREGLDIVNIPYHDVERLKQPFMVWADARGVSTEASIVETKVQLKFAGFPDARGVFKSDITDAPNLATWIKEDGNADQLRETLSNMMTCQRPEVLGKLIGWYSACFYKQLFQKMYGKFPLLHVNGPAGLGKTELNIALSSLFFYKNESRPLSPGSTNFALTQHLTASSSIPLILDEYKPHEMMKARHDALKALFRDAYNQRDTVRGGGSRESDDYRQLQFTQLAAPLAFIAESAEEEAAVMERVVLVTLARPAQTQGLQNYTRFQAFQRNHYLLGIVGQYMAAQILNDTTMESFSAEFDEIYSEARARFMLTEADLVPGALTADQMSDKQNTKERPVYNHTVAKFGFRQFRKVVVDALGHDLDDLMDDLEDGIYARLSDLHSSTTPEYVKVLKEISSMSYHVEKERPEAIRKTFEYAPVSLNGRECVEICVRTAYTHYRMYCRGAALNPLFSGAEAFAHAVQDSSAFIKRGSGDILQMPGVYLFDVAELARLGVDAFK